MGFNNAATPDSISILPILRNHFQPSILSSCNSLESITFNIPENKKEEIKVEFPGYFKYISRGFENKSDVMNDREVSSTKCYLCHKNLKKKIRWYSPNSKNYYSVSYCDVHGYIKYKVRVKKAENGKYFAIKTSKFITEEKFKKIQEERNKDKEHKKMKKKLLPNQE